MDVDRNKFHLILFSVMLCLVGFDFILLTPQSQLIYGDTRGIFHSGYLWKGQVVERPYVDTPERRRALRHRSRNESDCTYVTKAPDGSMKLRVLFALRGSGATWLRSLIELSTGYYTGSHNRDNDDYMAGFGGESLNPFDRSVIAIRSYRPNMTMEFQELTYNRSVPEEAIVLVRNPYDSILSSYYTAQYLENGTIDQQLFSTKEWLDFADFESRGWLYGPWFTCLDIQPSLVLFYEDIVNDTETQLRRILEFVGISSSTSRIKCALYHTDRVFSKYPKPDKLRVDPYTPELKKNINMRIKQLREKLNEGGCGVVPEYEVPVPDDLVANPESDTV